jgi:hypothetical protein
MPPKRKDNASGAAGSNPKRSKPTFRTPGDATSQAGSSKNRIVTLRTQATGRRGYRTQDLQPSPDPGPDPVPDSFPTTGFLPTLSTFNFGSAGGSDTRSDAYSPRKTKVQAKKKNTTTVRDKTLHGILCY